MNKDEIAKPLTTGQWKLDPLLLSIQHVLEGHEDNRVPLTLNVDGMLIAGDAVSESVFVKAITTHLRGNASGNGVEFMASMIESLEKVMSEERHIPAADAIRSAFIYLVNARVWHGHNATPSAEHLGVPWRVRAADVCAWTFGQIGTP